MLNSRILMVALIGIVLTSSCKKDDDGDKTADTTCTESREFWLDGSIDGQPFVTSEPCGNLRLSEVQVSQAPQGGPQIFSFYSYQSVKDSLGNNIDTFRLSIAASPIDPQIVDTVVYAGDTTYSISATNICSIMKLGRHYPLLYEATQNNTNAFNVQYTDGNGMAWRPILAAVTDSSFVVTSIDGIVSQNPSSGAYYPYCTIKFSYDLLMEQQTPTADTLHLKGTGRLGFR